MLNDLQEVNNLCYENENKCKNATCNNENAKCCTVCLDLPTCKETECHEMIEWRKYRVGEQNEN